MTGAPGRHVPWPQPLALGMVAGVAAAGGLAPRVMAAAGMAALLAGALLLARRRWRWPSTLTGGWAAWAAFLAPVLLAAGVGALRLAAFEARPDPLVGRYGTQATWRGYSDGDTLHARAPVRARLALVAPSGGWPGGRAPIGELEVTGVVEAAPGKRNPGGFDLAAHLRRRGVAGQLFVREHALGAAAFPLKQRLQRGVQAGMAPDTAALTAAMTLGLRDDLGELRGSFAASGLAHLLALSGLHVGVLLLAAERLMRPLGRWRTPALLLATAGFVALVGPSPSIVRAATMAAAALASRTFGAGRVQPWTALALACLIGLLSAPQMLFDLSFQLSYLAVVGLLLFLPPWLDRLGLAGAGEVAPAQPIGVAADPEAALLTAPGRAVAAARARLRGRLAGARRRLAAGALARAALRVTLTGVAVSTAAQLPSLSLVAGTFGTVPLLAPLVNVVAVPTAGLLVPLGFLAGLVGLAAPPLARLLNLAVEPLARLLVWLSEAGARLPSVAWGEVGWLGHACWAAFVVALAAWAYAPRRLKHTAAAALTAGGVAWAVPAPLAPPDVWYLDVGQGDAALVRLRGGEAILVDGGGSPFSDFDVGERVVLPALRALGVTRLALVVATHPDADHVEGLLPVLQELPVGLLVTGPPTPGVALDAELRRVAEARGVPVHVARRAERLSLRGGEVRLDVLNPPADASGASVNEASVAFVLRYRGVARALFLGDLGVATEPELAVPPVDVLMVGHHGSRHSTGDALLRAARPGTAVISVGRNGYGHPAAEVLERLEAAGARVLTTQRHGAVRVGLAGAAPVSWLVRTGKEGAHP